MKSLLNHVLIDWTYNSNAIEGNTLTISETKVVLEGIHDENAGIYRKENVLIGGASHRPPDHVVVQELMERFVETVENEWSTCHPVERAAKVHAEFVKIHPFIDGNGRTSRLLMNYELMKAGFPPAVIKANNRAQYYDALDHAHTTGNDELFIQLVSTSVNESLDLWLSVI
ncbi:Fic family protein [Paenibacillus sp. DS2015]|uniref:Fic family protein n=1 Tax=Paenibacillus sp. DS2015 TaxID=3373917 RepID=UPI003D205F4E